MSVYESSVRQQARELWLAGGRTDAQIAAMVGVARVDTIRDWRREEDWDALQRAVEAATASRRDAEARDAKATLNRRHDQLGEALESLVVRAMKSSHAPRAGEIRALAGALLLAQRVRRTALGLDAEPAHGGGHALRPFPVTFVRRPAAAPSEPADRRAAAARPTGLTPAATAASSAPGAPSPNAATPSPRPSAPPG